jgi:MFS family permease
MLVSLACLGILAVAYITNAMDRNVFPALLPWISKSYGFALKDAGLLSTVFTLGIGLASWPTGYLLDRHPRKFVLVLGMVIYSFFTLATIWSRGFADMLIYRTMTGVGEAMQIAALFASAGSFFYKNKALVIGTINVGYGLGGFLAPYYGTRMTVAANSWHVPMIVFAGLGIVMAAVIWFGVPDEFTESKGPVSKSAVDETLVANVPKHFWNRNLIAAGFAAVMWGFCYFGFLSLYSTFLIRQLHFAPMVAGTAFGLFGLGAMFGMPAGWLGDRYSNRWVAIGSWCAVAVVWYLMYNVMTGPGEQKILSFLVGLFASSSLHPNGLSLAQRCVRPEWVGGATGVFLSCGFLAAAASGYAFGWLVQLFGWSGADRIQLVIGPIIAISALLLIKDKELFLAPKRSLEA